jgi:hypothetical protein
VPPPHTSGLHNRASEAAALATLRHRAQQAGVDPRDLEAALIRLSLAHRRTMASCPGGSECRALSAGNGTAMTGAPARRPRPTTTGNFTPT